MSEFTRKQHEEEMNIIRERERKAQLEEIYNRNNGDLQAIEKKFELSQQDGEILEEIAEEASLQARHDQAFLDGFLNGGKRK